jgi:hypothetical protein
MGGQAGTGDSERVRGAHHRQRPRDASPVAACSTGRSAYSTRSKRGSESVTS